MLYRWALTVAGQEHTTIVSVRYGNVKNRGRVPAPPGWESILQTAQLPYLADTAAARAAETNEHIDIGGLTFLGVPIRFQPPLQDEALAPGALVGLCGKRECVLLLCAHVEDDLWYCFVGDENIKGATHQLFMHNHHLRN